MEIKESKYKNIPVISFKKIFNLSQTKQVQNLLNKYSSHIIVDLSGLINMDSTAIGRIMRNSISLDAKGKVLALIKNERIKNIFEMARLDEMITSFNSIEEAYNYITSKTA